MSQIKKVLQCSDKPILLLKVFVDHSVAVNDVRELYLVELIKIDW